jgi:hypothetical protein
VTPRPFSGQPMADGHTRSHSRKVSFTTTVSFALSAFTFLRRGAVFLSPSRGTGWSDRCSGRWNDSGVSAWGPGGSQRGRSHQQLVRSEGTGFYVPSTGLYVCCRPCKAKRVYRPINACKLTFRLKLGGLEHGLVLRQEIIRQKLHGLAVRHGRVHVGVRHVEKRLVLRYGEHGVVENELIMHIPAPRHPATRRDPACVSCRNCHQQLRTGLYRPVLALKANGAVPKWIIILLALGRRPGERVGHIPA